MTINPIPALRTCPLFVKTKNGDYVNSNSIMNMSPFVDEWIVFCNESGHYTKYTLEDNDVDKLLNFYA